MKMFQLAAFLFLWGQSGSVPIDNEVIGDPEIECGSETMTLNVNVRNEFEGHVYVKGLFSQPDCRNDDGGRKAVGIELPFGACNVRRTRSLSPKGVFLHATVIVSFHPLFLTKVDRAYRVQCFYMETSKTVDTGLEVSMLTTELETQTIPMPICEYEILEAGPSGARIEYAIVGQPVYHKWSCRTETIDTFCMVVHSCFVDDTNGDTVTLIGTNGCAQDRNLVNNLEYSADLMAGVEAHVFKYADRAELYFQCQVSIFVKEPDAPCPRPLCPEPGSRGAGSANIPEGIISAPIGDAVVFPLRPGSPYLPGGLRDFAGFPQLRSEELSFREEPVPQDASWNENLWVELDQGYLAASRSRREAGPEPIGTLDLDASLSAFHVTEQESSESDDVGSRRGNDWRHGVCVSKSAVYLLAVTTIGSLTTVLVLAASYGFRMARPAS